MSRFRRRETTTVFQAEDKFSGMTLEELRTIVEEYNGSRFCSPKIKRTWVGTILTLTFIESEYK